MFRVNSFYLENIIEEQNHALFITIVPKNMSFEFKRTSPFFREATRLRILF